MQLIHWNSIGCTMQGDRYFGVKGTYKAVIGAARDNTRFFQKRLPAWYILSGIKKPFATAGYAAAKGYVINEAGDIMPATKLLLAGSVNARTIL